MFNEILFNFLPEIITWNRSIFDVCVITEYNGYGGGGGGGNNAPGGYTDYSQPPPNYGDNYGSNYGSPNNVGGGQPWGQNRSGGNYGGNQG